MIFSVTKNFIGKCYKNANKKRYIIIHDTGSAAGTTVKDIISYFKSVNKSCHYIIGYNGAITQITDENDRAWHAGVSSWKKEIDLNQCSIGIEILSDGHFTDNQRRSCVALCKDIMFRNAISAHNVLRHADIAPKRKSDVRRAFFAPYKTWGGFQSALLVKVKDFINHG